MTFYIKKQQRHQESIAQGATKRQQTIAISVIGNWSEFIL